MRRGRCGATRSQPAPCGRSSRREGSTRRERSRRWAKSLMPAAAATQRKRLPCASPETKPRHCGQQVSGPRSSRCATGPSGVVGLRDRTGQLQRAAADWPAVQVACEYKFEIARHANWPVGGSETSIRRISTALPGWCSRSREPSPWPPRHCSACCRNIGSRSAELDRERRSCRCGWFTESAQADGDPRPVGQSTGRGGPPSRRYRLELSPGTDVAKVRL